MLRNKAASKVDTVCRRPSLDTTVIALKLSVHWKKFEESTATK